MASALPEDQGDMPSSEYDSDDSEYVAWKKRKAKRIQIEAQLKGSSLVEKPTFTQAELDQLVTFVKKMTTLYDLRPGDWTQECEDVIKTFMNEPEEPVLTAYFEGNDLKCMLGFPTIPVTDLTYFFREDNAILTPENFHDEITFGTVDENVVSSILLLVEHVYAPMFFQVTKWPDTVKNEFCSRLHTFLGNVTDYYYKSLGLSVLYIPREVLDTDLNISANDKELVKRLESVVVLWTRQIRTAIGDDNQVSPNELLCPSDEYEFWVYRHENLTSLHYQVLNKHLLQICEVLVLSQSTYVQAFKDLCEDIKQSITEATSNIKFLNILLTPCEEIKAVQDPSEIPPLLPKILNLFRIIWTNSPYYNSSSKITALCASLSNQIIIFCKSYVKLDMVFEGKTRASIKMFRTCIKALEEYKIIYQEIKECQNTKGNPKFPWDLDDKIIFSNVDAFIFRCNDMIEVCETMIVFGRYDENDPIPKPLFSGQRGPEFEKICEKVEDILNNCVDDIKKVQHAILDVQNTKWFQEILKFRIRIKECEIIIENLMIAVFEQIITIDQLIETLGFFYNFYERPSLKSIYSKKTEQLYTTFSSIIQEMKTDITNEAGQYQANLPYYAGRAIKLYLKKYRAETLKGMIDRAQWLPPCASAELVFTQYENLVRTMKEKIQSLYEKWIDGCGEDTFLMLKRPLLCKSTTRPGLYEVNFDRTLKEILFEAVYWEKIGFDITLVAPVYKKMDSIYFVYESMLRVCIGYNRIVTSLSDVELQLFKYMLLQLDRKIAPGLKTLDWTHFVEDTYLKDVTAMTEDLQEFLDDYKKCNLEIVKICEKICDTPLIQITPNYAFDLPELNDHLTQAREKSMRDLAAYYRSIVELVIVIFEGFESYINHMGPEWIKFVMKFDELLETSIRICIKNSLQIMYQALHGDGSTGTTPLLKLTADLKNNLINFEPSVTEVAAMINNILPSLSEAIGVIPRISETFHLPVASLPSFRHIVQNDEECKRLQTALANEVTFNIGQIQNYKKVWDPFVEIWQIDKDRFIKRYELQKPNASAFDANIGRYTEVANNVSIQETVTPVNFLVVHSGDLKKAIINHCFEWQNRLCQLLLQITIEKIDHVYEYVELNGKLVMKEPTTLSEIATALNFFEQLQSDVPKEEAEFPTIEEQIRVLDKYQIDVEDPIRIRQGNILKTWKAYLAVLEEARVMIFKTRAQFKNDLLNEANKLAKDCEELLTWFYANAPFSYEFSVDEAFEILEKIDTKRNNLLGTQSNLRRDLSIFHISQPENMELQKLDKDFQMLKLVWDLTYEWDNAWEDYKTGEFWKIKIDDMDETVNRLYRKLHRLSRELKEKKWTIVEHSRNRVDAVRRVIPLIVDLKNPAMRDRHWDRVKSIISREFDQTSKEFTLELILDMAMQNYADEISEVSAAATGELQIELGIQAISDTWEKLQIYWQPGRDSHKIKSVDDATKMLEEHVVSISVMKSSKYVLPFQKIVDGWERTLAYISETLENILNVQRQYLYMENIFTGEAIQKQLSKETNDFHKLREEWKEITSAMSSRKSCLQACTYRPAPYLLNKLNTMLEKMEVLQRALEKYLETKRYIFPRFYFISNDDLLEILGSSKKPELIQPHLKQLFDNLNKLKINKHGIHTEALGMVASDGEYIDFVKKIDLEGAVEMWLNSVQSAMRICLREQMKATKNALRKMLDSRDKWLMQWPGQCGLTSSIIQWTADCVRALTHCKLLESKKPLRKLRKKQNLILTKLSELSRRELTKLARNKTNALITIEIHSRDVIDRMYKAGCTDVNAFEWFSQLRFYWDRDIDDVIIRQTNTSFLYFYEYLGNSGRLVITPLTDRCYITLTTALHLYRGGSPKGPAGTGKTETVKDLGKALGMWVIVINCSEGLDYKSMGKMFSGLSQAGVWGCFDEFNRINIEVLSVVAQQILSILSALSLHQKRFHFEGAEIALLPTCGFFITMNPGYAGRTELPDNLKSMFRPISMMTPDNGIIAENLLFSDGFQATRQLSKKVVTLYQLAMQQLSRQDHYDFGLRSMVALLRYAGQKRREHPDLPEEQMVYLAMADMNIAKLTSDDLPLFNGIMADIFPHVNIPHIDYDIMVKHLRDAFKDLGVQPIPTAITKVLQLYETKCSRHSVMILGKSGTAKTITWKGLKGTLGRLAQAGLGYVAALEYPINPKALNLGELYGEYNLATGEWLDGVLSSIMRETCHDENTDQKWILFDGPVDAVWIENMNSVMDDNKILTLINSERITMPEQVSLLFEVGDLSVASPATVSRCGMVYNDYKDWGWRPYVTSWLSNVSDVLHTELHNHFEYYIDTILDLKRSKTFEIVPVPELNLIMSLCRLLDCFVTPENGCDPNDQETLKTMTKLWFLFCMIWSVCITVDSDSRKKFDSAIREMETVFPLKDTIYEYYVDVRLRTFVPWEGKLTENWTFSTELPFHKITVPTIDTIRYDFIMSGLLTKNYSSLITGPVGTGKTNIVSEVIQKLDNEKYTMMTINMSAQTSSKNVQDIVESRLEKRTKLIYAPFGNKQLVCLLDDLNMPAKDFYGSQPPLELLRLWIDYGFWYDRQKQWRRYVKNMQLMAAMGPPGGGRTIIPDRFLTKFNVLNMTFPDSGTIRRIYGTMLRQHLREFDSEVKSTATIITEATLGLYYHVCSKMLPTPAKTHYLFNLRDISKVYQGLLRSNKDFQTTKPLILRLWIHETFRVFYDRLINEKDQNWFVEELNSQLGEKFELTLNSLCLNKESPIFGDFINPHSIYEDLTDFPALRKYFENQQVEYNLAPGTVRIDLVLFKDAIEHVCRIIRIISLARGNALLVGVGGSGRQSLSRLASYICECVTFQIEIKKQYGVPEFKEDLKKLYKMAGVESKLTTFMFTDTQVVDENFLEIINNMLNGGEVTGLFKKDEFEDIKTALENPIRKNNIPYTTEAIYSFFIQRVCEHLHIILCMSPIGDSFRNRLRQYPALVNCTTIDWFLEWPVDALLEVAYKSLKEVDFIATITGEKRMMVDLEEEEDIHDTKLGQDELVEAVASVFAIVHKSVAVSSQKMLLQLKRYNYVTPTNYLELVEGYKRMLNEKRLEKALYSAKLRSGVGKIEDTRLKVTEMTRELEIAQAQIIEYTAKCDEVLLIVTSKRREADDEAKEVAAKSAKIEIEEKSCKKLADSAQTDLDKAMPALNEAILALDALNKKDITEIRSFVKPPQKVEMVLEAVMILKGVEPTWTESKKQLSDNYFLDSLRNFDKDNINEKTLKKIAKYTFLDEFQPDKVGAVSLAAKSLCMWVIAIEKYAKVWKIVAPKKAKLDEAMNSLTVKQNLLAASKAKLKQIYDTIAELQRNFDEKLAQKEELNAKAEILKIKLERAALLVEGLSDEKVRWAITITDLELEFDKLPGDVLLSTAFLSYLGPFVSNYREELVQMWIEHVVAARIPSTLHLDIVSFLTDASVIQEWNAQGLPSDKFSTENGIIVTRGTRWPLIIDPQCQAVKWIRLLEKDLQVIDFGMSNYTVILESSLINGKSVLLQNVGEKLEPSLNPILNRAYQNLNGRTMLKFNDRLINYNDNFRFYMATKLPNPHYLPEISTKTTLVNFAVKKQGLEAQLLGIVVRKEKPALEEQKDFLVTTIATGRRTLKELENELLRLLYESEGSLLDNLVLINTLQVSKKTSLEVIESLQVSEVTEVEIDKARELYRVCARRAAILFFVLNDLARIDPMYQFSLDSYIHLFISSISGSPKSPDLDTRLTNLNDFHTFAVYKNTCRALFEQHKLLFSFHMCMKILEGDKKLNLAEYLFLLKGGVVLNRENQPENPAPKWLTDEIWDNITEFDKLPGFHGIITSFEQNSRDWHDWYIHPEPESIPLVGEWNDNCNDLQRMVFTRCLRPDRFQFCATQFISNILGQRFVEPPVLDIKTVLEESIPQSPLIFVLSPGVDPTGQLLNLADAMEMANNFVTLSLGQGQSPIATKMIMDGIKTGLWVYLANCHLSLSWMPALDKIVENLQVGKVHKRFRLWLSSNPTPEFPLSILQTGIKMTTEPPKGLKANLKRLYNVVTDEQFSACQAAAKYKKLLFSLCFFHSVLIERKKFQQLGWNVIYSFNDSDFEISQTLLSIYLDEYPETPWDALKYLIAGVNYGGHVTDDWDRRLLTTYINQSFNEAALTSPLYRLSSLPNYYIPKDGSLESYQDYITVLPSIDHPEAFGQHPNADIASLISETKSTLGILLSIQGNVKSDVVDNLSREDKVINLANEILSKIPRTIDYDHTYKNMGAEKQPLDVVLLQEILRYNVLLESMKLSLEELKRGIQGFIVMSSELEEIYECLNEGRVPQTWLNAYPSLKRLGSWTRDLVLRVEHFSHWANTLKQPLFFWLAAYTYPVAFLTAVLQIAARQNQIPIDTLSWEFNVFTTTEQAIASRPEVGVFVRSMYLEGAGWNSKLACLEDPEPMKLIYNMPLIHFKPTEALKKRTRGIYNCPCYYFPIRTGIQGRPAYVITVDLKSGTETADYWIKRGTALLLSLSN